MVNSGSVSDKSMDLVRFFCDLGRGWGMEGWNVGKMERWKVVPEASQCEKNGEVEKWKVVPEVSQCEKNGKVGRWEVG